MGVQEDSDRLRAMVTAVMRGDLARDRYVRDRRQVIDDLAAERSTTPLPSVAAARGGTSDTVPVLKPTASGSGVTNPLVDVAADIDASGRPVGHALDQWIGFAVVVVIVLVVGLLLAWIW